MVGPAVAPLVGGVFTHYASWRAMQVAIALAAVLTALLMYFFLTETAHAGTRGCDKDAAERVKLGLPPRRGWGIVWVNPYRSVRLLRSPNMMAVVSGLCFVRRWLLSWVQTLAGTAALLTDFGVLFCARFLIWCAHALSKQ